MRDEGVRDEELVSVREEGGRVEGGGPLQVS